MDYKEEYEALIKKLKNLVGEVDVRAEEGIGRGHYSYGAAYAGIGNKLRDILGDPQKGLKEYEKDDIDKAMQEATQIAGKKAGTPKTDVTPDIILR